MEQKVSKIGVSQQADQSLDRMMIKINEGFNGGHVTKNELTTWIINYFETQELEDRVEDIRKDYFDQLAYLESVVKELKQAKKNGASNQDISALVAPVVSQIKINPVRSKRRSKQSEIKQIGTSTSSDSKKSEINQN